VEDRIIYEEHVEEAHLSVIAGQILDTCTACRTFLLHGQLGAGKTSLVRALTAHLGYHKGIASPTFSIINEYLSDRGVIYHMDLYRVKNEAEALDIGLMEYLDSGAYIFIEWPDVAEALIEPPYYHIRIQAASPATRTIEVCLYTGI